MNVAAPYKVLTVISHFQNSYLKPTSVRFIAQVD